MGGALPDAGFGPVPAAARMADAGAAPCPVCASARALEVLQLTGVPEMCNLLYASREAARGAPRSDIDLTFCETCGHLWNPRFDPSRARYQGRYENALHFSPRFRAYAQVLAARLIDRYALRGRRILEIGCGDGAFLQMICRLGGNRGVGVDPAAPEEAPQEREDAGAVPPGDDRVQFVRQEYSARFADLAADLVCFRHLLEHLGDPAEFLRTLPRRARPVVFCEVPNAEWMLRRPSLWDLIYEHPSYFTAPSLAALFRRGGFDVLDLREEYGGQYLSLEARPAADPGPEPPGAGPAEAAVAEDVREGTPLGAQVAALAGAVERFGRAYRDRVAWWRSEAAGWPAASLRRAVVWGAGSKGVSFLNALEAPEAIAYVVDVNPRKQGGFIAGTGHPILAPESLRAAPPDVVIVMNPIYEQEIREHLTALGVAAAVLLA